MICLDTNVVVAVINRRVANVRTRLTQALTGRLIVGIPAIVLYELWYGISKSARPEDNAAVLRAFWHST